MAMGCLYIILIIAAIVLTIYVGMIVLPLAAVYFFVIVLLAYLRKKALKATEMKCPNCGSSEIKIHSLQTGSQTQTNFSSNGNSVDFKFLGYRTICGLDGGSNSNTSFTFKREGVCQKCGFNFDYLTQEDVNNIKVKNKVRLIIASILLVLSLILSIVFWSSTSKTSNEESVESALVTEYTFGEKF